ncbi:MAG: OmpP1/FadL family transporter [Thermovirgaceae bacterium]
MGKKCGFFLLVLLLLFFTGSRADTAGFALYEFSARGNALGGAMVGRADDPSAIAFNAAGITQIPGSAISVGASFIMPSVEINSGGTTAGSLSNTWIPPHFYYTKQLSEKTWLGLGIMSRFGLGTEFHPTWLGRYNSYYAAIQSVSFNPNIAWKISDTLSVSLGAEAMWFEYEAKKRFFPYDTDILLKGDSIGWGWNLGLLKKFDERVSFGFSYRSEVKQAIEGNASFSGILPDGPAQGDITLPEMFFAGILFNATDRLSFETGAVRTNWSSYDNLTILYGDPQDPMMVVSTPKYYEDVWRYNVGIEWEATPQWTWRLSYVYDESPIPDGTIDYQLPANDRHLYSFGIGYKWDETRSLDLSYTYISIEDRDISGRPKDGIPDSRLADGDTHIVGLTYNQWL